MGFVAARCTSCGANITVDEGKEAGICQYCGTAFVTEKVINNYNTFIQNTNYIQNATIVNDSNMESEKKSILHYMRTNNYAAAKSEIDEFISNFPYSAFGYEQKILYSIKLLDKISLNGNAIEAKADLVLLKHNISSDYKDFLNVATPDEQKPVKIIVDEFDKRLQALLTQADIAIDKQNADNLIKQQEKEKHDALQKRINKASYADSYKKNALRYLRGSFILLLVAIGFACGGIFLLLGAKNASNIYISYSFGGILVGGAIVPFCFVISQLKDCAMNLRLRKECIIERKKLIKEGLINK